MDMWMEKDNDSVKYSTTITAGQEDFDIFWGIKAYIDGHIRKRIFLPEGIDFLQKLPYNWEKEGKPMRDFDYHKLAERTWEMKSSLMLLRYMSLNDPTRLTSDGDSTGWRPQNPDSPATGVLIWLHNFSSEESRQ